MQKKHFYLSLTLAMATFFLLIVGALVHPTGSSLACPDWPTCYGSFFPEMEGGIFFEHSHRIVATIVGFLTVLLNISVWGFSSLEKKIKVHVSIALMIVILQGVLGGITVILKLPPAVSISHLGLSMFFFCFVVKICFQIWQATFPQKRRTSGDSHTLAQVGRWAFVLTVLVYLQVVLGGVVRHFHAGRSCGSELPFCESQIWPAALQQQIHMTHRIMGVIVFLAVLCGNIWFLKARRKKNLGFSPLALIATRLCPMIVSLQVLLGLLTVASMVGLVEVVAHTAVGALLLAIQWLVFLGVHDVERKI